MGLFAIISEACFYIWTYFFVWARNQYWNRKLACNKPIRTWMPVEFCITWSNRELPVEFCVTLDYDNFTPRSLYYWE